VVVIVKTGHGVSIHAPREGSDAFHGLIVRYDLEFQSTLPVRGATSNIQCVFAIKVCFNPRSP